MLSDEVAAALPELRAQAESLMTDTCQITKPGTGQGPWNPSTGTYDPPPPVEVYGPATAPHFGKCRLKTPSVVNPFQADSAGTSWRVEQSVLSLPVDADLPSEAKTVNYLTAPYNPSLEGRVFGITGPARGSQTTAQRVLVQEVVGTGA